MKTGKNKKLGLIPFYLLWAEEVGWTPPHFHIRVLDFLEHYGELGLLMMFRGASKSTLLGIYNAWRFYQNPSHRILLQGADQTISNKCSKHARGLIEKHPLCNNLRGGPGEVEFWWCQGAMDDFNPSFQAKSIMSTVTSSRADEIQNDDVEVPINVSSHELREKLRTNLSEQTHILVPGGKRIFIGTPHTHESIYKEVEALGADSLKIALFGKEHREDLVRNKRSFKVPFKPSVVFGGIGKTAKLFRHEQDYALVDTPDGVIVSFHDAPDMALDFYADQEWSERFTPEDLVGRRRNTPRINLWDSQYQLRAVPSGDVRLSPERLRWYEDEPILKTANGESILLLNGRRMVGGVAYWDPSLGQIHSDVSALTVLYTDEEGNLFWHRSVKLEGDIEASQLPELRQTLLDCCIRHLTFEVNGPGGLLDGYLRKALAGTGIAAVGQVSIKAKNLRILDSIEGALAGGILNAHASIETAYEGTILSQMRDWNPAVRTASQKDDWLDSLAGAIALTPVRIGRASYRQDTSELIGAEWRPGAGTFEATLEGFDGRHSAAVH